MNDVSVAYLLEGPDGNRYKAFMQREGEWWVTPFSQFSLSEWWNTQVPYYRQWTQTVTYDTESVGRLFKVIAAASLPILSKPNLIIHYD